MTKVQTTLKLHRGLSDQDLIQISRVNAQYGFFAIKVQPSGLELLVEYDASRLSLKEVRATFEEHGIPLA